MVCKIGGILYHDLSSDAAARLILKAALSHTAFAVFTPGATIAAQAEKDPSLLSLLGRCDLCLPDGVGCKIAARLYGTRLSHVAPGIDTAERLLSLADAYGLRVFLYGGKEGVAQAAALPFWRSYWLLHIILGIVLALRVVQLTATINDQIEYRYL